MKFIATVEDATQKYDIHLEVPDDDAGRTRVGDALTEIQQRFIRRGDGKKTPPRIAPPPRTTTPPAGEANRDK
jgi:methylaspartate ammonia-lyase